MANRANTANTADTASTGADRAGAEPRRGGPERPAASHRSRRERPSSSRRRFRYGPYLLILPSLAVLCVVLVWPIIQMVWISLHSYTLRHLNSGSPEWNSFAHYVSILSDGYFWRVFANTIAVTAIMVVLTMVLGTLVGLLLHKLPRWFSTIVAVGLMLAWATPVLTASFVYRWMFWTERGLVNYLLQVLPDWLVGSGWDDYNWFIDAASLFTILILIVVWQSFPFVAVSVLAGLKSIPHEMYEAARVDGAGPWRSFWSVTFPMLRPLFALILILQIIWDFRVFTQLFVLANGFQNRDVFLLSYYSYQQGFAATPANYGMGSAIAVIMTVLVLVITAYHIRMMIRQGELR
ncbi:carbohydrate ABC transporter permease [Allonocardiopsis opalescens]|uniref:N,N'-diacetylchitobiose transport system permease protein n=1 Tax=Allonocardiopsis opalescens TaxID=1144618 RepID=A0A2T0QFL3_9ACTN|nr:sugar ABC transporter permease [Allonocardiopsis opalescens]PRY02641.1 N,N'-diacetylchitobiose transport system permease protein [Allonocardiopsis opalescens]